MNKSFYYLIPWSRQKSLKRELIKLNVPFSFENADGECAVVFPDLPVRQFHFVYQTLGGPGKRYPQ